LILLADNDIILKLAQCDLLGGFPELLGEPAEQVCITPAAKYQLLPKKVAKAIEKCGDESTVRRIRDFLDAANEIPAIKDEGLLRILAGIDKIDDGEALLFAASVELPNPILATGDRNALRALLAQDERLSRVVAALRENVVTFESAILLAIHKKGFANVKQNLLNSPRPDGVLRLVLKPDMRESDLSECLQSYIREVAALLRFRPLLFGASELCNLPEYRI
jgi:hypothetical protein